MARRVSEKRLRESLVAHGGNVVLVAAAYGVARQTIYNWVQEYGLRDEVDLARETMFMTAERNINLAVQAGNLDASKFVLTHMPVEGRWSSRSELTGKDGGALFAPDVMAILEGMGYTPDEIRARFEAQVRAMGDGGQDLPGAKP